MVLACPAYAQAALLSGLDAELSGLVGGMDYLSVAVVCLGYERPDVEGDMDGFGFLVPSREKREILGTVADSYVFPNRAPDGRVLLRTLVGGARTPERALLADEKLLDEVVFLKEGEIILSGSTEDLRSEKKRSIEGIYKEIFSWQEN